MHKIYIEENIDSKDLLKKALADLSIYDYTLIYNEYGKPFLKDASNIHFNLSHTKNVCICVISDKAIGVDIQEVKYYPNVLNYYTDNEIDVINQSENKALEFTRIWTKKESYIKMLGYGMSYGLKNVDTINLKKHFIEGMYKDYVYCICLV